MKKLLFWIAALIVGLTFAVLLSGSAYAVEGTKILTSNEGVLTITVPEMCPDFLGWPARLLGAKKYPNGNKVVVVEAHNGDNVFVTHLWMIKDDKFYCLQIMVTYFPIGMEYDKNKPKEEQMVTEYLEDVQFMNTSVLSGTVQWVKDMTPWKAIEGRISAQLI